MASLYQVGSVWWILYRLHGKRYRRSLRTTDRKQAQKDFEEIVARIRYGRLGIDAPPSEPTMRELFDEYLPFSKAHRSARTWRDTDLHIRRHLRPFFGKYRASQLTPKVVEEFIGRLLSWTVADEQGNSVPAPYHPRTINLRLETLRKVLRRAVDNGTIAKMPCRIKLLREPKSLPRYVQLEQFREWLAYLDPPHRLRALFSLCTGISDRDLGFIQLDGCDLGNRLVRFRRPKTTTDIVVPLNGTAQRILEIVIRDNPGPSLFPDASVRKAYATASREYKKAGGVNITPHMLRHSFATILLTQGVPIAHLRDLLGHASIETTQRYAKVVPDHLRAAVAALDGPALDLQNILSAPRKKPARDKDRPARKKKGQEAATAADSRPEKRS